MKRSAIVLLAHLAITLIGAGFGPASRIPTNQVRGFRAADRRQRRGRGRRGGRDQARQSLYPTVTVGGKEYKIELVIADNKSDKVEAANAGQRLVDSDKVKCPGLLGLRALHGRRPHLQGKEDSGYRLSCTNPLVPRITTSISASASWILSRERSWPTTPSRCGG